MQVFLRFVVAIALMSFAEPSTATEVDENGILILTNETFHEAVTSDKYILVKFHVPESDLCETLEPEYPEAAQALADIESDMVLAKVNGAEQQQLVKENRITSFPSLRFYTGGKTYDYEGERTANEIVDWLLFKKRTHPVKPLPFNSYENKLAT